jgi:hypothetical protein
MHSEEFFDYAQDPIAPDSIHDFDPEQMDIHGKLVALNAVGLSSLTLTNRCAMILLSGPWVTDDLGRFMGPPGFLPDLNPLSKRQVSMAIGALTDKGLIKTWQHAGSQCWEVAGAYTFIKNRKAKLAERSKLAHIKRVTVHERKARRSEEFQGEWYIYEDDGSPNADDAVEFVRTKNGGHVPMRPTFYQRSVVPVPEGTSKYKMIVPQPKDEKGMKLHLYPSFNVYAGLNPLGVVIRHLLIWEADDYGKVRIDIERLHGELGPTITKRTSKSDIEQEIARMSASGHLMVFTRASGTYAYVRDAAQHMLKKKFKNMEIPRLVKDREFTHDSDAYRAFFDAWRAHAITREKVEIRSYAKGGVVYAAHEYVEVAAERFVQEYEEVIHSKRFKNATVETIYAISLDSVWEHLNPVILFYYGYRNRAPLHWMESFYRDSGESLSNPNENDFKILRHLMGMTPEEYLQKLSAESTVDSTAATD